MWLRRSRTASASFGNHVQPGEQRQSLLVEETLRAKRRTRAMPMYQFVLELPPPAAIDRARADSLGANCVASALGIRRGRDTAPDDKSVPWVFSGPGHNRNCLLCSDMRSLRFCVMLRSQIP